MRLSNLVISVLVVAAATTLWAAVNRPVEGENWLGPIKGVSFSPFQYMCHPLSISKEMPR